MRGLAPKELFETIYERNIWGSSESRSGVGAETGSTSHLVAQLRTAIGDLGVASILDIPCGDANWILGAIDAGVKYTGADVVARLIEANRIKHRAANIDFQALSIIDSTLPRVDMIFCRDCLQHFPGDIIFQALDNCIASSPRYIAITTFTGAREYEEIEMGDWRPINFTLPPFNLPEPRLLINEQCQECGGAYEDKSIGIWDAASLKQWQRSRREMSK